MNEMRKARCSECPHLLIYQEKEARRQQGVIMRYGMRYCTYCKKAQRFKPRDPKIYVPKWCPRLIHPPILRIYGKRIALVGYPLRSEGRAQSTGRNFYSVIHKREKDHYVDVDEVAEELGAPLRYSDIIEFDDGVKPLFFHLTPRGLRPTTIDKDDIQR